MQCTNHPEREAAGTCAFCGKMFCQECLVDVNGRFFCKDHVSHAFDQSAQSAPQPQIVINNTASSNSNAYGSPYVGKPKSKILSLLLCIFLGYFGAHYFYVGRFGMGILYLFTMGFFGIGWFVDIFRILVGSFKDNWGRPVM